LQNEGLNNLYRVIEDYIPESVVKKNNKAKSWAYGYNKEYDLVVISKDGIIGEVVCISGLYIGLPKAPEEIKKGANYWMRKEYPKHLERINSIFQWNEMPREFKDRWVDYIEEEFDNREEGYWFLNNNKPTYITGAHYMYLQWTKIDVGYPDYREANRIFFIYWEACKADKRCFGMVYLKIRRSGFSIFIASCQASKAFFRDWLALRGAV